MEEAAVAEMKALKDAGMTAKEAEAYMNTNAAALEVSYLVAAGYTTEQANAFIAAEELYVSENQSEI